jgi:hypothetical protein
MKSLVSKERISRRRLLLDASDLRFLNELKKELKV